MESLMDSSEEIFKLDKDMITFKIKFGDLYVIMIIQYQ